MSLRADAQIIQQDFWNPNRLWNEALAVKKRLLYNKDDWTGYLLTASWYWVKSLQRSRCLEKLEFVIVDSEKIRGLVVSLDNRHFYMATSCAQVLERCCHNEKCWSSHGRSEGLSSIEISSCYVNVYLRSEEEGPYNVKLLNGYGVSICFKDNRICLKGRTDSFTGNQEKVG